jgi:hypothetical protein
VAQPNERDYGLMSLVERLMGKSGGSDPAETPPASDDGIGPAIMAGAPELLEPQLSIEGEQTRSKSEMAEIILRALRSIDGCPRQGFEVTVYGERPWNAMLRITPAAGRVGDARIWRDRVRAMAYVLRGQYDVVE